MANFILIHGAWHRGSGWDKVVEALGAAGHSVVAPDLPGRGADETPHKGVDLRRYSDSICDVVDSLSGDVILVGHSLGGLTISQVAENRTDRIQCLVYVAAFLPGPGDSVSDVTDVAASQAVSDAMRPSQDGYSIEIDLSAAPELFYGDCSDEDVALAVDALCPEPQAVLDSKVELSEEAFGSVPRDYIVCLKDRTVVPDAQRSMIDRYGCRNVYSVDRSHSPFLSAPEELAKILGEIADG
jgi:pimeloyl-ACP methyl ester carboxylesterase